MAIRIGSNSAALGVTRRIDETTRGVSQVLERLGSGARINRASDDAAGLAIASSLNARSRVLNRARSNVADASSLVQIADGALSQVSNVLTRMTELAEQAANGSYSSVQRRALDNEYQQLDREIRRVVASSAFNGLSVLSGERSSRSREVVQQAGSGLAARAISSNGRYALYHDGVSNTLYRKDFETGAISELALGGESLSANSVQILDNGDAFFATSFASFNINRWKAGQTAAENLTPNSDLFDGTTFRVSADGSSLYFNPNVTDYVDGGTMGDGYSGADGYDLYKLNLETGIVNKIADELMVAGNTPFVSADGQFVAISIAGGLSIRVGRMTASGVEYRDVGGANLNLVGVDNEGNAIFSSTSNLTGNNPNSYRQVYKFNGITGATTQLSNFNALATLNNLSVSNDGTTVFFRTSTNLAGAGTGNRQQIFRLDTTLGTLEQMTNYQSQMFTSYTSLMSSSGNRIIMNHVSGTSIESLDVTSRDASFDIEAGFGSSGNLLVQFQSIEGALRGLRSHTLRNSSGAYLALEDMRYNLQSLAQVRGVLGAAESRLISASSLIDSQGEQFRAAESRLRDVDVATESARLTALRISQQVATSVLAQVNQAPTLALRLLKQ